MKAEAIIAAITTKVKSDLQNHADDLNKPLTAEHAENVTKLISNAILSAAGEGFKTYLLQNEPQENTIIVDDKKYQFNRVSEKEFQSTFGKIVVPRRLYQDAIRCLMILKRSLISTMRRSICRKRRRRFLAKTGVV